MRKIRIALIVAGALLALEVVGALIEKRKPLPPLSKDCPICHRPTDVPGHACLFCALTLRDGHQVMTKPGFTAYATRR